jgi:hypothetical protein
LPLQCAWPSHTKHAADNGGGALRRLHNAIECLIFAGIGSGRFLRHLRVVEDGGEDIVEFMGHAAGKGAHAAEALSAHQLFAQPFHFSGADGFNIFVEHPGLLR